MKLTKADRNGIARLVECGWTNHHIIAAAKTTAKNRDESFGGADELAVAEIANANRKTDDSPVLDEDLF